MAGSKSNYLENELLDHVLGGADYARPATVYVALYTVAPSDAGEGTEVSTDNWTNYARVAVTNNAANWPAAADGVKANGAAISFGVVEATGTITVVAFGIFDTLVVGNQLYWGTLVANKDITNGDTPSFAIGDITITED